MAESTSWYWVAFANSTGPQGAVITRAGSQGEALWAAAELWPDARGPATAVALPVPPKVGDPPADCVDRKLSHSEALAAWGRWHPSDTGFGIVEIDAVEGTVRRATAPDDDVRQS